MSEKLTREQIERHRASFLQATRDFASQDYPMDMVALCDLALSAADAEQRGRAQGLAEAVKVAETMAAQIDRDLQSVDDGKDVLEAYRLALFHIVDRIRALSPSPDHVLVPTFDALCAASKKDFADGMGWNEELAEKVWNAVRSQMAETLMTQAAQ